MTPILNILHLESRRDRLQSFLEQTAAQSIRYTVWDGFISHKFPQTNISNGHKQIVRDARNRKLKFVVIAEDDIKFSSPGAWSYYLSQKPDSFDMYFGMLYAGETDEYGEVQKGRMSGALTLYTIHERFYDTFLAMDEKLNLDYALGLIADKHDFFVCKPMVCFQENGFSDHFQKEMNYDVFLEGKTLYKS